MDVTGADLDGWFSQSGTWSMAAGSLGGTGTAARIVRPVPVPYDRFVFSYHTAHDPANPATYNPEYYAMAVLRVDPASTAWRYVALVIEPNGAFLREWVDDQPTELAANPSATTSANVWYDVEVRFNGANIEVWRGERGQAKTLILTGSAGTGLSSNLVGLGVGAGTDYRFDDVGLTAAGSRVAGTASYAYDALGRRISKTVDGTTTYYGYTGNRVVEERAADGTLEATYVYGSYIDEVLQMRRGGQDYYYHADDQYNVVALTDATGNVVERYDYGDFGYPEFYAPDGAPRSGSSVGNPWLFTGRQWDPELGCYYYRSRYLDPLAGTFLSRDPIGLWGDPGNLGNGNAYCGNNPWSMVDPFGLQAESFIYGGLTASQRENLLNAGFSGVHSTLFVEPTRAMDPNPGYTGSRVIEERAADAMQRRSRTATKLLPQRVHFCLLVSVSDRSLWSQPRDNVAFPQMLSLPVFCLGFVFTRRRSLVRAQRRPPRLSCGGLFGSYAPSVLCF